jgi:hypothetical protein
MDNKRSGQVRYPSELKDRAVRMVRDLREQDLNDRGVITRELCGSVGESDRGHC